MDCQAESRLRAYLGKVSITARGPSAALKRQGFRQEEILMSLHARVSRVDDYAGELTLALKKLEMEHARGALDRDQQTDFLEDLRKTIEQRDLRPMRNRALLDLFVAALTLSAALLLPQNLGFRHPSMLILLALCALTLGMAACRLNLFRHRRRHDKRWLKRLDDAVASGGTIFDAHI